MKKIALLSLITLFFCASSYAQLTVDNPSFEGPTGIGVVPAPWAVCDGTPDTQPGQFMVSTAASDGMTYLGFVTTTGTSGEGATQSLSAPMTSGQNYLFTIDLSYSAGYNGWTAPCKIRIYGSNSNCGKSQVLWTSPLITHLDWQEYNFNFTPNSDYTHITFSAYNETPGSANVLLDNLSPITPNTALSATAKIDKDTICAGECVQITSLASGGDGGPYTFNWTSIPAGFTSVDKNPGPGCFDQTSQLILTVEDGSANIFSDTLDVFARDLPNVYAGVDTFLCIGFPIQLNASGATDYSWSPLLGLSKSDIGNPLAFPNSTTTYTLTGTDAFGCENTEELLIEVRNSLPPVTPACGDITKSSIEFTWNKIPGATGYLVSEDGGLTWIALGAGETSYTRTGLLPNTETELQIKPIDAFDCNSNAATASCLTNNCPILEIDITSSKDSVAANEGFTLFANVTGGSGDYDYSWNPLNGGNASNYSGSQSAPTVYSVSVSDNESTGCPTKEDSILIFLKESCEFTLQTVNAISLNSDGLNDLWSPKTSCVEEMNLSIFNRWGERIYQESGAEVNWDGAGNDPSQSLFLFILNYKTLNGEIGQKTGTIYSL
jgi:gliding motility-associated-like protein